MTHIEFIKTHHSVNFSNETENFNVRVEIFDTTINEQQILARIKFKFADDLFYNFNELFKFKNQLDKLISDFGYSKTDINHDVYHDEININILKDGMNFAIDWVIEFGLPEQLLMFLTEIELIILKYIE